MSDAVAILFPAVALWDIASPGGKMLNRASSSC